MKIGTENIEWVSAFKYLGVNFYSATTIKIDFNVVKRKFYAACNNILCHSTRNNELVRLQLLKTFCLPLITYCLGAIDVPHYKIKELGVCWNDIFRKLFGYNRWESVKELQWFLGEPNFERIYYNYRKRFLDKRHISDRMCLINDLSSIEFQFYSKLELFLS